FAEVLKKRQLLLPADHPHTLISMINLAHAYQTSGKLKESVALFEQTYVKLKARHGDEHPITLMCQNNLAVSLIGQKQTERAEPLLRAVIAARKKVRGPEHPDTLASQSAFLSLVVARNRGYPEAEEILREVMPIAERVL